MNRTAEPAIYLDSSALVKRYVEEPDSDRVRHAMEAARRWLASRLTYVESMRAVLGVAREPKMATGHLHAEWGRFTVIDLDQDLAVHAAQLAHEERIRSLDAIHLASALSVGISSLVFATWDRNLWVAAKRHGLTLLPASRP